MVLSWIPVVCIPFVLGILLFFICGFIYHQVIFLPAIDNNYDYGETRRKLHSEKDKIFEHAHFVKEESGYYLNERNILIHHKQIHAIGAVKAVIALIHGFGDHSNGFMKELGFKFAANGFTVVLMDFEGHGNSDGLHGLFTSLDDLADDLNEFLITKVMSNDQFKSLKLFLYAESMGGAIAFKLCTKSLCDTQSNISKSGFVITNKIAGVVLAAPMVKVSDKLKPPPLVVEIVKIIARFFPTAPIAPVPDIIDRCYKRKDSLNIARHDPKAYKKKPRLQSAIAMINATDEIGKKLDAFSHVCSTYH